MRRRDFLFRSGLVTAGIVASTATTGVAEDAGGAKNRIFEIRTYHFASSARREAFEKFVAAAAVAAWNRAGAKPVGVFRLFAKDNPDLKLSEDPQELWVFLPHKSPAAMVDFEERLAADKEFQSAGEAILSAPKSDPAFTRYENMLLRPMSGSPNVATPSRDAESLFEMRTYESPNLERHLNKLAMFSAGEFGAFERAGMPGIFFGGAIAASNLPQLTYMVLHRDADGVKKQWTAFGADPDWQKLKSDPQYKDNVSKIIKRFLRAAAGSQI